MKKILLCLMIILFAGCVFIVPSTASDSGPIPIGYPSFEAGYTNQDFGFTKFQGGVALFNLTSANLAAADAAVAAFGATLNGTSTPASLVSVTAANKMVVLNHASSFLLYPGTATSPFPSIWVKGTAVNPATGVNSPLTYITGAGAITYYQTGLTIQSPYYDSPDYQWTVYVYADKDIISDAASSLGVGRILDPRVATMRWFSWQDDANGTPKATWGVWNTGEASATMFNTIPLFNGSYTTYAAQIKAFLTGTTGTSLPETAGGYPVIAGLAQASIPNDGQFYYNTDRNIVSSTNANGFTITNRSQIGLVYASPNNLFSHRNEKLRLQFIVNWPAAGVALGSAPHSCTINFYQRTQ